MSILVLWSETDHKSRAELLAQTYQATAINFAQNKAVTVAGVDTLVFWGHGAIDKFCSLEVDPFLQMVTAWRHVNPGVKTVEMISCNLRHRQGTSPDSYTMRVVSRLKRRHAGMVFKALPVATSGLGVTCENSILKWQPSSRTWAYVAAPGKDDRYMWKVCHLLEAQMPPNGVHDGYVRAHNELMNSQFLDNNKFAKLANGNLTTEPCRRKDYLSVANNSYAMTGGIGSLRWALEEIK